MAEETNSSAFSFVKKEFKKGVILILDKHPIVEQEM